MINRYDQFQPLQFNFTKTPLEPLAAALEMKQKRFDTFRGASEELYNQKLEALQQDRPEANAILADIQSKIDSAVERSGGDYSRIGSDLYTIKREINKLWSPGGKAHAISSNRAAFISSEESERKRLDKGEITQEQFNLWRGKTLRDYTGIGEFDPVSGRYNVLAPTAIAAYVDDYELGIDVAKELKPFVRGNKVDFVNGSWIVTEGEKRTVLPPEFVANIVANRLMSNKQYMNYISQLADLRGAEDPVSMISSEIMRTANTLGNAFARDDLETERGLRRDPAAMIRLRHSLQKELLEKEPSVDWIEGRLTSSPFTEISEDPEELITMEDKARRTQTIHLPTGPLMIEIPEVGLTPSERFVQGLTGRKVGENVPASDLLKLRVQNSKAGPIGESLANSIIADMPGASYEEMAKEYNKSLKNASVRNTQEVFINDADTQKEMTSRIIESGDYRDRTLVVLDPRTKREKFRDSGHAFDKKFGSLTDDKGKAVARISRIERPVNGIGVGFGTVVPGIGNVIVLDHGNLSQDLEGDLELGRAYIEGESKRPVYKVWKDPKTGQPDSGIVKTVSSWRKDGSGERRLYVDVYKMADYDMQTGKQTPLETPKHISDNLSRFTAPDEKAAIIKELSKYKVSSSMIKGIFMGDEYVPEQ